MTDVHHLLRLWAAAGQALKLGYPGCAPYVREYRPMEWESSEEATLDDVAQERVEQAVLALPDEHRAVVIAWYLSTEPPHARLSRLRLDWRTASRLLSEGRQQVALALGLP
jgi:DNA-directed RNA polymerase specialized sigma24 family protein